MKKPKKEKLNKCPNYGLKPCNFKKCNMNCNPQDSNIERLEKEVIKEFLPKPAKVTKENVSSLVKEIKNTLGEEFYRRESLASDSKKEKLNKGKIPCDCLRGGVDGYERICKKCNGAEWVFPQDSKKEKSINYMQVGKAIECSNCHPKKGFMDCQKELPKYGKTCECICHSSKPSDWEDKFWKLFNGYFIADVESFKFYSKLKQFFSSEISAAEERIRNESDKQASRLLETGRIRGIASYKKELLSKLPEKRTQDNLPFEPQPEMFGNQRLEAYRNGFNTCFQEIIRLIQEDK